MKLDIVINIDNKYVQHTHAMLCSLFENNRSHEIQIHVLTKELCEDNRNGIELLCRRYNSAVTFYEVDGRPLRGVQYRKNRPLSEAAYYRLLLADILPEILNKVLYLDVDLVVLKDVSELFLIELDGYALAATLDQFPYTNQHRLQLHMTADQKTFCSGIMLVNLEYWRTYKVTEGLLEYARRKRVEIHLHDQDVLNYYFKNKWFMLPPKWNRIASSNTALRCMGYKGFDYREYTINPCILHYADITIKPWVDALVPYKEQYLKYLYLSGYKYITMTKVPLKTKIKLLCLTIKSKLSLNLRKILGKY